MTEHVRLTMHAYAPIISPQPRPQKSELIHRGCASAFGGYLEPMGHRTYLLPVILVLTLCSCSIEIVEKVFIQHQPDIDSFQIPKKRTTATPISKLKKQTRITVTTATRPSTQSASRKPPAPKLSMDNSTEGRPGGFSTAAVVGIVLTFIFGLLGIAASAYYSQRQ